MDSPKRGFSSALIFVLGIVSYYTSLSVVGQERGLIGYDGLQMQVQVLSFLFAVRVQVTPTQDALPKPCLYLRRFFMWGEPEG